MSPSAGGKQRIGTLTIMFVDLVASTELRELIGEEAADQFSVELEDAFDLIVKQHRGHIVKQLGDGAMASFAAASDAVSAAVAVQRHTLDPADLGLEVALRIGLAAGDVRMTDDDCKGMPVVEAARLEAAAAPGQILCTEVVTQLTRDRGGHRFSPVGPLDLKGIQTAVEVWVVDWRSVHHDVAQQMTPQQASTLWAPEDQVVAMAGNLPIGTTSLLGRESDVAAIQELLQHQRLVTLTGPGGVGKTRLALEIAFEVANQFPDGVWTVELAAVSNPSDVLEAVGAILGVGPTDDRPTIERLAEMIGSRRMLLLLDNCEHVLDAVADLVETLLARVSILKILTTSRETMRLSSEHVWAVRPLGTDGGASSSAVRLFVERSRAVDPTFTIDEPNDAEVVIEICERLDGVPLAIELAAARMGSMSAAEIRDRLDHRFRLLTGRGRGHERQRTLRQVVQWSYDLLDEVEQAVLQRCSVFVDGFDLDAATVVGGCVHDLDEFAVLDILASLVGKSLLSVERVNGRTRYAMLETTREFLHEQLEKSEELGSARSAHGEHYAVQAVLYSELWNGPSQRSALEWVDVEFANLRQGFAWATTAGEVTTAATIASHTALLGWMLQRYEAVTWAEEILPAAREADLPELPKVLTGCSLCAYLRRPQEALTYAAAAAEFAVDLGYEQFDPAVLGMTTATAHLLSGDVDGWLRVCRGMAGQSGLTKVLGQAGLTWMLKAVDRVDEAQLLAQPTVELAQNLGNPGGIVFARFAFARAFVDTDPIAALEALRSGLVHAQDQGLDFWESLLTREAAALEAVHGKVDRALLVFDASIKKYHQAGNVTNASFSLAYLAVLFNRVGQSEVAATLYGATTHYVDVGWVTDLPAALEVIESQLDQATFQASVANGVAMEFSEAVQYASEQIRLTLHGLDHERHIAEGSAH